MEQLHQKKRQRCFSPEFRVNGELIYCAYQFATNAHISYGDSYNSRKDEIWTRAQNQWSLLSQAERQKFNETAQTIVLPNLVPFWGNRNLSGQLIFMSHFCAMEKDKYEAECEMGFSGAEKVWANAYCEWHKLRSYEVRGFETAVDYIISLHDAHNPT